MLLSSLRQPLHHGWLHRAIFSTQTESASLLKSWTIQQVAAGVGTATETLNIQPDGKLNIRCIFND
jgi:hypothetical protein